MSLHTAVHSSLADRLHLRREARPRVERRVSLQAQLSIGSMRILETGLALSAIATALLIGHR